MTDGHTTRLVVSMAGTKVGTLASDSRGTVFFAYDAGWLETGFDLSRNGLKFAPRAQAAPTEPSSFNGLHGVFSDSLPDGWGRLLMDRALMQAKQWSPRSIAALDRLAYMGSRAMGALEYAPELLGHDKKPQVDLAALALSAEQFLGGDQRDVLRELMLLGGSPGGARPKVTVARRPSDGACVSGFQPLAPGFEHWLVKFRGLTDPVDSGRVELAYATLAQAAGLQMPATDLIEVDVGGKREAFFAVKRFDREGDQRVHMLSLSGYLHATHHIPCVDYETVLAATHRLTGSFEETKKAFRLMVFNSVFHNRDDHSKNFAFLRRDGAWKLSPAFDLTMSAGPGGQHWCAIDGSGDPSRKDVLSVAGKFGIADAKGVIDQVVEAATAWPDIAARYDVSGQQSVEIQSLTQRMMKRIG